MQSVTGLSAIPVSGFIRQSPQIKQIRQEPDKTFEKSGDTEGGFHRPSIHRPPMLMLPKAKL